MAQTLTKSQTTVGGYLLDRLAEYGVHHVFGIPGDYVLRFDKCIEEHSIFFVNCTRENTAGYMADAYARCLGMGAVCITFGVGINIINAISQAHVESSPVVLISGAPGTKETKKHTTLHHYLNEPKAGQADRTQLEIFEKVTAAHCILSDPALVAQEVDCVLATCFREKQPVYIEIPRDMVDQVLPNGPYEGASIGGAAKEELGEALAEMEKLLLQANKPLLWLGHEVLRRGLSAELLRFAKRFNIPILSTLLGKSVVDEKESLFLGVYQGEISHPEVVQYAKEADTVLALGVLPSDVDTGGFTADLKILVSARAFPNEVRIGRHTYPTLCFSHFVRGLSALRLEKHYAWGELRSASTRTLQLVPEPGKKISVQGLFAILQSFLGAETLLVTDVGDCLFGSADLVLSHDSFLAAAYFTTLGFGVPGAVGAQIARPSKRVVALVGDGAFQMTMNELATAVRYGLDPIVIVMNNYGYGTERPILEGAYNDIHNWEYTKLPELFRGGRGYLVTTEDGLQEALSAAFSGRGEFALIEVRLDKEDYSDAMLRFCQVFAQ